MKLQIVPARQGARWLMQGLRAFGSRPMVYMSLIGTWVLVALIVQILPVIGLLFAWTTFPLLTLGFMLTTQLVLHGRMPTLQVFVQPLRGDPARRKSLWQLGAMYAFVMAAVLVVSLLTLGANATALPQMTTGPDGTPVPGPIDPRIASGMLWMALTIWALSVPFSYAPALVHWAGQSAGQALFSSIVAVWRNKAAFIVFALASAAGVVGISFAVSLVAALFGTAGVQGAMLLMVPIGFAILAIFYASLYFTYADCFGAPEPLQEPTP